MARRGQPHYELVGSAEGTSGTVAAAAAAAAAAASIRGSRTIPVTLVLDETDLDAAVAAPAGGAAGVETVAAASRPALDPFNVEALAALAAGGTVARPKHPDVKRRGPTFSQHQQVCVQ